MIPILGIHQETNRSIDFESISEASHCTKVAIATIRRLIETGTCSREGWYFDELFTEVDLAGR